GLMAQEYSVRVTDPPPEVKGFMGTGNSYSVLSGRVSYTLGLEGPSMTVDTACSSSLVAMHLAGRSLRNGECDLALAGGVTVMATPALYEDLTQQGNLAADGRCKAFSDDADGAGFGEGIGVLLLERLSDAQRNGHPVLAILAGSAVNSDGASNGLTAPNGPSQERVIRAALASAGLSTSDVDVVEAHGTGTALGDPIEAQAILATYGQDRERPLRLGTVKSNIGHTQAAAGVAGVIKMVEALRRGVLPKTLHATVPSSKVDWSTGSVELLTENTDWPEVDRPRRAGVSSFGLSGTNAHVILEQAPPVEERALPAATGLVPWVLSGHGTTAVRARARALLSTVEDMVDVDVASVGHALATTRTGFAHRAVVTGTSPAEFVAGLSAICADDVAENVVWGRSGPRKVVFVFPGQGSQWAGMGRALLESSPVFAAEVDRCDVVLRELTGWSVLDVLREDPDAPELSRVDVLQPVLFTMMVSLAALWRSYGVLPAAVIGHSQGEIAAAHVAGALSLADAARIVAIRSRLLYQGITATDGGMLSIVDDVASVRRRIAGIDGVSIAAVNGPRSVAVAGSMTALRQLERELARAGVMRWQVPGANFVAHSAAVDVIRQPLVDELAGLAPTAARLPLYSTVTGEDIDTEQLDADYWFSNVREPVEFERATRALLDAGHDVFIEISPHPILTIGVEETITDADARAVVLGTLHRDAGGPDRMTRSLAEAVANGVAVDWNAVIPGRQGVHVDLPTYPFERERFWLDASPVRDVGSAGLGEVGHPLLGAVVAVPGSGDVVLSGRVSLRSHSWLADHAVDGVVLFPGTGFLELALCAAEHVGCVQVEELVVGAPLVVPERGAVDLLVVVGGADESEGRSVGVFARTADESDGEWVRHAFGRLSMVPVGAAAGSMEWPPAGARVLEVAGFYEGMAAGGFAYGPAFQGLTRAWRDGDDGCAEVVLPQALRADAGRFAVHPALLDASLHVLGLLRFSGMTEGMLPFTFSGVCVHAVGASAVRVRMALVGSGEVSIELVDGAGEPVVSVRSLLLRPRGAVAGADRVVPDLYRVDWQPITPSAEPAVRFAVLDGMDLGAVIETGTPVPEVVVASCSGVYEILELTQAWLADDRFVGSRLAVLSRGAVATTPDEFVTDPVGASVWGLVRAAEAENPGRFVLVDHVGDRLSAGELASALGSGATQVAVRDGIARAPRLGRVSAGDPVPVVWGSGRVLVTGGTGTLGRLVARHLVVEHGVRELLLVSRRGADEALRDELAGLGAEVVFAAVDAADREALAGVLAKFPVSAVVHCAGVLDDGLLTTLTPERFTGVLAAKMTAAENLYELTRDSDLSAFVTFSSGAATVGGAGQANYATANAFLDGFASWLRGRGVRATSLAWGMWDERSQLTRHLTDADVERLKRGGVAPLSSVDGLSLFDTALGVDEPVLLPIRLELSDLDTDTTPAILHNLVRPARRRAADAETTTTSTFRDRLTALNVTEQHNALRQLVVTHTAAVVGFVDADAVEETRSFRDFGLDSLTGVELRNRLAAVVGERLPATLVFDYPTPIDVARHLGSLLIGQTTQDTSPAVVVSVDEPVAVVGM
ncbi:type I polyketide synthase, partial [Actinophytocola sediminis]